MKIEIKVVDQIYMTIEDNGNGCEEIVKGNGLIGIEERAGKIKGSVRFVTEKTKGFRTEIILPIE